MDAVFAERQRFGRFFYRFPDGEAGTDVFDRVATFLSYLWLTFGARGYHLAPKRGETPDSDRSWGPPAGRLVRARARARVRVRVTVS